MLCRNFVPDQKMPYRVTIPDYKGESKTTGKNIALIDKPLRIRLTISYAPKSRRSFLPVPCTVSLIGIPGTPRVPP
jgi:hypothetical protein